MVRPKPKYQGHGKAHKGKLGVMDYYQMQNVISDTNAESISGAVDPSKTQEP